MTIKIVYWKAGALMLTGVACNRKASAPPPPSEVQIKIAAPANVPVYVKSTGIKPVCLAF